MSDAAVYARLRVTDPGRWRAVALAWRRWAALVGVLVTDLTADIVRFGQVWTGPAAAAAIAAINRLCRRLQLFRVLCWQADQTASEFAAALDRAQRLLARTMVSVGSFDALAADAATAVALAAEADAAAAERLGYLGDVFLTRTAPASAAPPDPGCAAPPLAIARWWAGLDQAQRWSVVATEPGRVAALDGIPAADRDAANRLVLDKRRADLGNAVATAGPAQRERLRELLRGLDSLANRLADDEGARAYLLRLDLTQEGRAVIALGDPDRADNVVTQVPGMTADLASAAGGELSRVARVANRAAEVGPATSTSAVLWLGYDAPDFVDEAASERQADAGAPELRRFMAGLRASHDGPPARQTLIGHSYGSLVVGRAAAADGLAADAVVFIGSPGVGVDSVRGLALPADRVWSSTSPSDVIQYAAISPAALVRDLAVCAALPIAGPLLAFGRPERDLWFGHNPSDPTFGARVFGSAPHGGHLGYWDQGSASLDALAAITLGTAR